jgi:hypothetical protein
VSEGTYFVLSDSLEIGRFTTGGESGFKSYNLTAPSSTGTYTYKVTLQRAFTGESDSLSHTLNVVNPPDTPPAPYYIGKGLKEPCYPYRSTYVFGADLGTPNANNWNCLPLIWDSTTYFDLSQITKNHEVVVALYAQDQDLYTGTTIKFEWYRERDNKLLFTHKYDLPNPPSGYYWDWYYAYSYIGWVDWEINENGYYYVKISDSARGTTRTIRFLVTGITSTSTAIKGILRYKAPIGFGSIAREY